MADFKTFSLPFDINTQSRTDSISAGVQFRSQDVGTAKLIFTIFKDGISLDLTDDTIKLNIRTADGSLFQLNGTVDHPKNGVASCVLSSDVVTHYGTATAELVILYTENQSLSVSQFTFDIEQSIVDQDITPSATYYIQNLQDFMGAVNDILGPLTDNVNTQIDLINQNQVVKLPDYNADKADTAAQLAHKLNISDIIDTGLQPLTLVNGTQGNAQYRTVTFNGIFKIIIIWVSIYNLPNNTACITLPADTQNGQNNSWLDPWLIVPSSLDTNDSHSAGIKIMPGNQVYCTLHGGVTPSDDYNFTYTYLV